MERNKIESKEVTTHKQSFIEESIDEIKRINWPNRDVIVKATVLVVGIVIFSTVYIAGLDATFSKSFFWINTII